MTEFFAPEPTDDHFNTYYTVLYDFQPGKFTFQVKGQTKAERTARFTPNRAEMGGEIDTLQNQMPGGINWYQWFINSHIYYGGAWQVFQGAVFNPDSNYFGANVIGPADIGVFDRACN